MFLEIFIRISRIFIRISRISAFMIYDYNNHEIVISQCYRKLDDIWSIH